MPLQSPSDDQQQHNIELPMSPADSNVQPVETVDLDSQLQDYLALQTHSTNPASEAVSTKSNHDQTILNCLNMGPATFDIDYQDYSEDIEFLLSEMTDHSEQFVVPHMPFITAPGN